MSDAKEVIQVLKEADDWSIRPIISDIKGITSLFNFVIFYFIPRSLNGQAHKLAKLCFSINNDII